MTFLTDRNRSPPLLLIVCLSFALAFARTGLADDNRPRLVFTRCLGQAGLRLFRRRGPLLLRFRGQPALVAKVRQLSHTFRLGDGRLARPGSPF